MSEHIKPRVKLLIKRLRKNNNLPSFKGCDGKEYTPAQLADEIENETKVGRTFIENATEIMDDIALERLVDWLG